MFCDSNNGNGRIILVPTLSIVVICLLALVVVVSNLVELSWGMPLVKML